MEVAETCRKTGNEFLLSGNVSEAIKKYTEGLLLLEKETEGDCESCSNQGVRNEKCLGICIEKAKLYSNRSHAYYMEGDFEQSLENAQKCIETRPNWDKGYIRKALAFIELSNKNGDIGAGNRLKVEAIYKQGIDNCGETEMLREASSKLSHARIKFQRARSPSPLCINQMKLTPVAPKTVAVSGTGTSPSINSNDNFSDNKRVVWDEAALERHMQERGKIYGTMKIDQPDTPFLVGVDIENNLIGQVGQNNEVHMLDIDKLKEKLEILQVRQEKGEDLIVTNKNELDIEEQKEILRKRREDFLKARDSLYSSEARFLK